MNYLAWTVTVLRLLRLVKKFKSISCSYSSGLSARLLISKRCQYLAKFKIKLETETFAYHKRQKYGQTETNIKFFEIQTSCLFLAYIRTYIFMSVNILEKLFCFVDIFVYNFASHVFYPTSCFSDNYIAQINKNKKIYSRCFKYLNRYIPRIMKVLHYFHFFKLARTIPKSRKVHLLKFLR